MNVMLPVGPAPLLLLDTISASVTVAPDAIEPRLLATLVVVAALVMVTESVLLVLG